MIRIANSKLSYGKFNIFEQNYGILVIISRSVDQFLLTLDKFIANLTPYFLI